MLLVGLTGGIGSGKSVVARMLEERGAVVFDADLLAHRAIAPGTPGHDAVVERFGPTVLAPGGDLDREALASIVFADPAGRRDLEAIVHPEVRRLFAEGAEAYRDTDAVVVLGAPLLVETGMHTAFDVLIVVSTSAETQVDRDQGPDRRAAAARGEGRGRGHPDRQRGDARRARGAGGPGLGGAPGARRREGRLIPSRGYPVGP
jgi:dephospho-CoA kinase